MKINTYQFGEIEFDENHVISFSDGIIGFENLKKFILLSQEDGLFFWLTSVDEPEIVFPLFPVKLLVNEYNEIENFEAFGIVKLDKTPSNISINLKAPVYLNQEQRVGYQKIFDDDKYPLNYQLFVEN